MSPYPRLIQCAAAMQGSQQVLQPDQKDVEEMQRTGEAIRKGEPEEEATTSDKEMQEEIREAQAAVDECYRRWAEHEGIKVKSPRNRLMTEEELDGLSS